MSLQISLSLTRSSEYFQLPKLEAINNRILILAEKYINDTSLSERKDGSVCFWPYVKTFQESFIHSLSSEQDYLEVFDYLDLPNDLDTSSRLAAFLMNNKKNHSFIKNFVTACEQNICDLTGAYLTWVTDKEDWSKVNSFDVVVNLNILTVLAQCEQTIELPLNCQEANIKSCNLINEAISNNTVYTNSQFYDRLSEFFLSYAIALKRGVQGLQNSVDDTSEIMLNVATRIYENEESKAHGYTLYGCSVVNDSFPGCRRLACG